MSQIPNSPSGPAGPVRGRRAASVTLRGESASPGTARAEGVSDLMDPANKSLTDALRIAYRLLQAAIIVMLVLFVFSGIKEINASERGARVTLGKIEADNLDPGWHISWPQPIGDILKIKTNEQKIELRREFFPSLTDQDEKSLIEKGEQGLADGGRNYLDPDTDGAMLTADGYLVHARWLVTYTRSNDSRTLQTIASDVAPDAENPIERQIVTAAVRRGVVVAASGMTIDEVLYSLPSPGRAPGTFKPINVAAKEQAQGLLDEMFQKFDGQAEAGGIQIQQLDMREKMPPRDVIKDFNAVQSAQAAAGKVRADAESTARQSLTRTAGEGATVLLEQIDAYERALATGDQAEAGRTLRLIHDLMERKPVVIDGKEVRVAVSGDVSRKLADAQQYRTGVVTRAQGAAAAYNAKLEAFRSNPQVFLNREWKDAYETLLDKQSVTAMFLPPGLERLVMSLNRDPTVDKEIEMEDAKRTAEEAARQREIKRRKELHEKTFEGVGSSGGQ